MLKQIIKRGAQSFAARYGPQTRKHPTPRLLIVTYHRILPENDERIAYEEPGMTVTPTTLKKNLEVLGEYFEFIHLSDWLDRKQQGRALPNMACAITFDDGWMDNYEYAFPILEKECIPATIYVVSSMLGSRKLFWPERMARIIITISKNFSVDWNDPELVWLHQLIKDFTTPETLISREQITRVIAYAKKYSDQEIHQKLDKVEHKLKLYIQPEKAALLDWERLRAMMDNNIFEVGSHTCNHIRLNRESSTQVIRDEIISSKNEIESHIANPVKTFCFPNGDYSLEALNLVKNNYTGAVTTKRGWNTNNSDNHVLRRISVHEDTAKDPTSFLATISGWI